MATIPNERKDSVCSDCAARMGYEPDNKLVGIWVANCDFCGERKPLTSLSNDWHKKDMSNGNEDIKPHYPMRHGLSDIRRAMAKVTANSNKKVEDITNELKSLGGRLHLRSTLTAEEIYNLSHILEVKPDEILAAHNLEIAEREGERLTVAANYEAVIAAKDRIIAARDTEIAKLRECLREAVEWSCGNPDEDCADCVARGGETPCKCEKWRKVLEATGGAE